MDVAEWLRGLGLSQYEAAFRDNAIEADVLSDLTDGDLAQIGVLLGHRKRLLKAIASLGVAAAPIDPRIPAPTQSSPDLAERRQLTVMFCDLVGSTALSARLDPEDMREIIGVYHRCCTEIIERNGGFVAKFMGDGVLAYFGYPHAHEHDAERAVHSGLEIVGAAPKFDTAAGSPLHVRVGIATGLVIVGDLIGSGEAQERGVVGETPNLAARLQAIAEPDMVVIAEGTRRLLGNLFELQDLGFRDLKGIAEPERAWAALRASSAESRFDALHPSNLTHLVGRDEELELLLRRWSRAKAGEGQVVLLSGEAGIGKSRLAVALLESIADEPHTRLRYFCSPQHSDSAFYPIIGQMERAAGIRRRHAPRTNLDNLDAVLARTSTSQEHVALFAEMLSLPNDGRYPTVDLAPPQRRQRTFEALFSQVEALTHQAPVVMIFEDAHWSDPTSLDAFSRTVSRIETLRALLIVTFRSEFDAPWIGQPYVTALTLNRLAERDIEGMIAQVAGNKEIPTNIRRDVIERADGIPLFVEEITKAVLEVKSESEALRATSTIPSAALAVPATLHASLMARLDRLGPAKEVAQIGAAIGREFSHALLDSVARKPKAKLASALDRLISTGLLFRQGAPPHATYLFKHALVQDAAYGTLLRGPRRALHARIVETIETEFVEIAEVQPELLARHAANAGCIEKASQLWGRAAQRSLARSAFAEAVEQLRRALAQIASLPATPALRQEEIKHQLALIAPLGHTKGFGAQETKTAIERVRQLIEQAEQAGERVEDPVPFLMVVRVSWGISWATFDGDTMCALAEQFFSLAEKQSGTLPLLIGHRIKGISLMSAGALADGRAHFDHAVALYDPAAHCSPVGWNLPYNELVTTLLGRAWTLWLLGYPDAALKDGESALAMARELGHAPSLLYALGHYPRVQTLRGENANACARAEEQNALADERGASFWKPFSLMNQGCAMVQLGSSARAVELLVTGIAMARAARSTMWLPFYLLHLARAYAELGECDDAGRCIEEAMKTVEKTKEKCWEAEVYRTAGEIALKGPEPDAAKAEAYFERAQSVARAQQAKSWELRAATSLARLRRDQGKNDEARDVLAPTFGWFNEGFDTLDLKEAKALLNVLSS